MTRSNVRR